VGEGQKARQTAPKFAVGKVNASYWWLLESPTSGWQRRVGQGERLVCSARPICASSCQREQCGCKMRGWKRK